MAKPKEGYEWIEVESYEPEDTGGLHGKVHIRPAPGGKFSSALHVQCSKKLSDTDLHPVGTRFLVQGRLNDREGGGEFLSAPWQWAYEVLSAPESPHL